MKTGVVLILFLFATIGAMAQSRQLIYNGSTTIRIYDSKIDGDGNVVSVGYRQEIGAFPVMIKTDKAGNVLWSRMLMANGFALYKVIVMANGDYLAVGKNYFGCFVRMDKNGNSVCSKLFTFFNASNPAVASITELSNGNIAICGYNDFVGGSTLQYQGFIYIFSATGTYISGKSYGNTQVTGFEQYLFLDIACSGNRIYVVGRQTTISSISGNQRALFMMLDLDGNLLNTHVFYNTTIVNTVNLEHHTFNNLSVVNGQIFVWGINNATAVSSNYAQTIARVDTLNWTLKGWYARSEPYPNFFYPSVFIKDTNTFYISASPSNSGTIDHYIVSKVVNGNPLYSKKIATNSTTNISAINAKANDTVLLSGTYAANSTTGYYSGYRGQYIFSAPNATQCGVTDSTMQFYVLNELLAPTPNPPIVTVLNNIGLADVPVQDRCVSEWQLCGDTVCPPNFHVSLDSLGPLNACAGDTVRLIAGGCYPKTWLRNDTVLSEHSDTLNVVVSGTYKACISNNACFDTAINTIHVNIYPSPLPVITLSGDSLFSSAAVTYQWLDGIGGMIPGAEHQYYVPSGSGYYQVRIVDAHGCVGTSSVFYFIGKTTVSTIAFKKSWQLFPNPTTQTFTVYNPNTEQMNMFIVDVLGNKIADQVVYPSYNVFSVLNLGLRSGVYSIRLKEAPELVMKLTVVGTK